MLTQHGVPSASHVAPCTNKLYTDALMTFPLSRALQSHAATPKGGRRLDEHQWLIWRPRRVSDWKCVGPSHAHLPQPKPPRPPPPSKYVKTFECSLCPREDGGGGLPRRGVDQRLELQALASPLQRFFARDRVTGTGQRTTAARCPAATPRGPVALGFAPPFSCVEETPSVGPTPVQ
ncbi:hypothetical protein BHM03_00027129 [Ensete ventricosum]|nr:hypothetical protein BHM03_00027129 [Ensete ventricosum]